MNLMFNKSFLYPVVGDIIQVPSSQADKGKMDARNVLECIMEVIADHFLKFDTLNSTSTHEGNGQGFVCYCYI